MGLYREAGLAGHWDSVTETEPRRYHDQRVLASYNEASSYTLSRFFSPTLTVVRYFAMSMGSKVLKARCLGTADSASLTKPKP